VHDKEHERKWDADGVVVGRVDGFRVGVVASMMSEVCASALAAADFERKEYKPSIVPAQHASMTAYVP
jgi:hypothetical protein